jgi:hypothetical protein
MYIYIDLDEFRDWKLILYDFMYENRERMEKMFEELDLSETKTGIIAVEAFQKILEDEGLTILIKAENIKEVCEKHEKERNEFDYKAFLTGKKYLTKPYLMAAFAGKKKKKKKPKKGKKQKAALPSQLFIDKKNGNMLLTCIELF